MADENSVVLSLELDKSSASKAFSDLGNESKKASKEIGSNLADGFSSGIKSLSGLILGAVSAAVAGFSLKKAIDEATQAENATSKLNISLANVGLYTKEASENFLAYTQALEEQTAIESDLIASQASLLVSLGKLSGEGLNKATKAAVDLSKGLDIDLGSAFDLVAKAAAGNTSAFSRYGIKIDENIPKNQKFAATIDLISERFGGLAESLASTTFSGGVAKVEATFSNLLESIGKFVVDSPAVKETLKIISEAFISLKGSVDSFRSGDPFGAFIYGMVEIVKFLNQYFTPVFVTAFDIINIGFKGLFFAIFKVSESISAVALVVVDALVTPVKKVIDGYAEIIGLVDGDLGERIKGSAASLADKVTSPFKNAFDTLKASSDDSFNELSTGVDEAYNRKIAGSIDQFLTGYQERILKAQDISTGFKNNINENANIIEDRFEKMRESIGTSLREGVIKVISVAAQTIGASLVKGSVAFEDFGKSVLGIIGDLAIQIGTTLLSIGLGIDALKTSLSTLTGGFAIAAGLALIAVGGLLKAVGGGGLGVSTPGGVVAAPAGGGVTAEPLNPASDIAQNEPVKPSTQVAVNIQGNVFDTQETGLRIVDILNSAFDQQGVVVTGAV